MVRVYVRERGDGASLSQPRTAVELEQLEGLAVEDLLEAVAVRTERSGQEIHLMYGGRILKPGKTVDHYQIKDGCTVHLMPHKKKLKYAPLPLGPEGMAVIFESSTIQSEIAPFIRDPEMVAKMIPMGNPSEVREVLEDPDLLVKISDMAKINHYIRRSYMLYPVMLALLRLHRMKYSVQDSGRMEHLSMQVGQILELASGTNLGTHQFVIPREEDHTTGPSGEGGGGEEEFEAVLPSLGVTPADLATALASIGQDHESTHSSSLSLESSSQPLSLPVILPDLSDSSGPSSLPEADQQLSVPRTVNRSMSDSGRGDPGHGDMGTRHGPVSISEVDLQQALSLALGGVQTSSSQQAPPTGSHSHHQSRSGHHRHHTHRSHHSPHTHRSHRRHQSPQPTPSTHHSQRQQFLREMYTPQLEQLHAMGMRYSDSECLHALDAAQGDVETAVNILMGGAGD